MADNAVPEEATCLGCKSIPSLKHKAGEILKAVKTAATYKKRTSNSTQKNKALTSKKGKDKAPPPSEDSGIQVNFLTCCWQNINISIRMYPQMWMRTRKALTQKVAPLLKLTQAAHLEELLLRMWKIPRNMIPVLMKRKSLLRQKWVSWTKCVRKYVHEFKLTLNCRAAEEWLECSNLCFLPFSSHYWIQKGSALSWILMFCIRVYKKCLLLPWKAGWKINKQLP